MTMKKGCLHTLLSKLESSRTGKRKGEFDMKQYKAVPGPMNIQVDRGNRQSAFNAFADIINAEAVEGWTYHSMETITVTERPGCFQQAVSLNHYMLIFEREV